jgi:hypothetical protein
VHLLSLGEWQALDIWTRPTAAHTAEQHRGRVISKGDSLMPDWFTPVVITFSLIALAMFVAFWTSRKAKFAGAAVLMLALIVVVWLIARALPTDKRAIEAALNDIAAGIKVRSTDQVFANLAAEFKYRTFNKSSFRQTADPHIRRGDVEELIIRNFEVTSLSRKDKKAEVEFDVHPVGSFTNRGEFFLCRAVFILEDDGAWRIKTFELYNPFVETNRAIDISGVN